MVGTVEVMGNVVVDEGIQEVVVWIKVPVLFQAEVVMSGVAVVVTRVVVSLDAFLHQKY